MNNSYNIGPNIYDKLYINGIITDNLNTVFTPNPKFLDKPGKPDNFAPQNSKAETAKKIGLGALATYIGITILSGGKKNPITAVKTIGSTVGKFFKQEGVKKFFSFETLKSVGRGLKNAGTSIFNFLKGTDEAANKVEGVITDGVKKVKTPLWEGIKAVGTGIKKVFTKM